MGLNTGLHRRKQPYAEPVHLIANCNPDNRKADSLNCAKYMPLRMSVLLKGLMPPDPLNADPPSPVMNSDRMYVMISLCCCIEVTCSNDYHTNAKYACLQLATHGFQRLKALCTRKAKNQIEVLGTIPNAATWHD